MKKKSLLTICIIIIVICIIGIIYILNKNIELTNTRFISIMKKNSYKIYNAKEQLNDKNIKDASVAYNSNYQIEFITFNNIESSKKVFLINKEDFQLSKTEDANEISKSTNTYSIYTLTTSDTYMYIKRVNNSLLYIKANNSYIKNINNVLKKLRY